MSSTNLPPTLEAPPTPDLMAVTAMAVEVMAPPLMEALDHTEAPMVVAADLTRLAAMAVTPTLTLVAVTVEAAMLNTLLAALVKRPRSNNGTATVV